MDFILKDLEDVLKLCRQHKVKRLKFNQLEVELENESNAMDLSPKAITEALADSLPPDSQLLFAATEEIEETQTK